MSGLAILDGILSKVKAKRQAKAFDFWALARGIAQGKAPDADTLVETLEGSGKTEAELRAAVALYENRIADAAILAKDAKLAADLPEIEKKIQDEAEKLKAAEKAYEDATKPLFYHLQYIQKVQMDSHMAQQRLYQNCPDERILCRTRELNAEMEPISRRLSELAKDGVGNPEELKSAVAQARKREWDRDEIDKAENALAKHHRLVKERQTLTEKLEKLQSEMAKLDAERLKP